jgi:hypothetical protein
MFGYVFFSDGIYFMQFRTKATVFIKSKKLNDEISSYAQNYIFADWLANSLELSAMKLPGR